MRPLAPNGVDAGVWCAGHEGVVGLKGAGIGTGHELMMRRFKIVPAVAIEERLRNIDHLGEMKQFELR